MQMLYLVSFVSKFKCCDYNLFSRQKVENSRILPLKARINVFVVYINHKAFFVGEIAFRFHPSTEVHKSHICVKLNMWKMQ